MHSKKKKVETLEDVPHTVRKPYAVFISHCQMDKPYVSEITHMIEDMGIPEEMIICTSVPGLGIPTGEKIFDWLKRQFRNSELHVIYLLSENYFRSAACLNEMGAAWVVGAAHTAILLPGFSFENIEGCLDPSEIGISLSEEDEMLKYRLNQLKNQLLKESLVPGPSYSRWKRYRNDFIKNIKVLMEI